MRILTTLLLLIFISCANDPSECNYITAYYQTIYKADLEFETKKYKKAFDLYQDAFKSCKAINTFTYNEIGKFTESSAILKKFDITYLYAKKQILKGVEWSRFQNNSSFDEFLASDEGQRLEKEYDKLRKQFMTQTDFELRNELIDMRAKDQMYRTSNYRENMHKQDSIDKIHEKRLIELFEHRGYPNEEMVGPYSYDNNHTDVRLFLLHTKDSIRMNYFVPKVKEFVKNGTASPLTLGTMIDQYYLYNKEPQIYGTYVAQGGGYANMIDDLKKVDSNRISIGLPPLAWQEKKDSLRRVKYGF